MRHTYGIRIKNPGLLPYNEMWQGLDPSYNKSKRYSHFINPVSGIRALAVTLVHIYDKTKKNKSDTLAEIMLDFGEYRGIKGNAIEKQIQFVCGYLAKDRDEFVDLHDFNDLKPLIDAIIIMYNGRGKFKSDNTWYDDDLIAEGMRRAGVVKALKSENSVIPLTKESVGAGGVALVGVAQIADVLPDLVEALDKAKVDLSSGDWVKIVFGVATLAVSFFIVWAQIKKRKNGVV